MNRKSKRNAKLAVAGLVSLVAIFFLFTDTNQILAEDGSSFKIPLPAELLSFAGQTTLNSNASITCDVKQHTYGIDSTGITIANIDSKLLQGNPLLAVTSSSGVKMAGYVVEPRIFCQNNFNDDNLSNPERFTFVIDASSLILQVSAKDKDGITKVSLNKSFNTKQASIPIGGSEKSLGTVGVYSTEIEANMQDGSYATVTKFDLRGNLVVYWAGYAGQKYTIPIKNDDIVSYHNARIEKGSTGTTTYTGDDKDGDGIRDSYDQCPTQPENYNGYQDGDGCPDTAPSTTPQTTPTSTTPSPIIYTQCLQDSSKTWYMDSNFKTTSYCGIGYSTSSGICDIYDITTKSCVVGHDKIELPTGCATLSDNSKICPTDSLFKSGGICYGKDMDRCAYERENQLRPFQPNIPTTSTSLGNTGKIQWSGEVKYYDGTAEQILATSDPSPFSFSLKLNQLVGGLTTSTSKEISQLTLHPILKFDDDTIHKKMSTTTASSIKYIVTVKVKDSWITVKPISAIPDFAPTNGNTATKGISLGNIIVKMNDVENKVPATVVGLNDSTGAEIKVTLSGSVGLNYNDGTTPKPLTLNLSLTDDKSCPPETCKSTGSGDLAFTWSGLQIQRGTSSNAGGVGGTVVVPNLTQSECLAQSSVTTKYYWINNQCTRDPDRCPVDQTGYILNGILICEEKGITVTDKDNDGVIDESSGGSCAGLTPAECLAQGKSSDGGVNSSGGMCPLDGGAGDTNGDGKICQICIDSTPNTGGFPCDQGYRENYCNNTTTCNDEPKTGDVVGGAKVVKSDSSNTCQSNLLNLADKACVIQTTDKPDTSANNPNVCTGTCPQTITSDPNMIWYLAGGMILIGTIAIAIKRRK